MAGPGLAAVGCCPPFLTHYPNWPTCPPAASLALPSRIRALPMSEKLQKAKFHLMQVIVHSIGHDIQETVYGESVAWFVTALPGRVM